jgi:hypothetical protein
MPHRFAALTIILVARIRWPISNEWLLEGLKISSLIGDQAKVFPLQIHRPGIDVAAPSSPSR